VFPDDVKPTADLLPGDPDPVLSVDMGSAQIVTIRAVQELAAKVEALEKENSALKNKLGQAESKLAQTEAKVGENEKMRAEMDEVKTKLNELYKLLQAAAPGGGK
jgi:regulator of replication initiation timing